MYYVVCLCVAIAQRLSRTPGSMRGQILFGEDWRLKISTFSNPRTRASSDLRQGVQAAVEPT